MKKLKNGKKELKELKDIVKVWKKAVENVDEYIKKDLKSPTYSFK